MEPNFRNFALWVGIFLLVLALVTIFQNPGHRAGSDIAYSHLLNDIEAGRIGRIVLPGSGEITATYAAGRIFSTYAPSDPQLAARLQQKGVQIIVKPTPPDNTQWFLALIVNWLPILVFIGAWIFLSQQMRRFDPRDPRWLAPLRMGRRARTGKNKAFPNE